MSPEHREVAGRSGRWRDAMKWPSVPPLFSSVTLPGGTLGTLFSFSLHTKKKEGMREGGQPCSKGCSKCARQCPVNAITGVVKSPYTIDAEKCIKCGACEEACSFGAIAEQF